MLAENVISHLGKERRTFLGCMEGGPSSEDKACHLSETPKYFLIGHKNLWCTGNPVCGAPEVPEGLFPGQDGACGTSWQSPADRQLSSLPVPQKWKEGNGHTHEVLPQHHFLTTLQGVTAAHLWIQASCPGNLPLSFRNDGLGSLHAWCNKLLISPFQLGNLASLYSINESPDKHV